ncbi:CIA30 family protein [uncultured Sulfitobacter sp.]|uniref:CIA30 family protein n=1 Tax=uncultured Sulfitobacter sp. TaxID=191468 RepID=UPI0034589C10
MGLLRNASLAAALVAGPLAAQGNMMKLSPDWEYVADTVMGGVSEGQLSVMEFEGGTAKRLHGTVSLDNNGGFIQMAFDLADGAVFDALEWRGIELTFQGNSNTYEIRLRTDQLQRPWQSYRAMIETTSEWQTLRLPWTSFAPHRTEAPFDPARLRRIGVLAIGSEMVADVSVAEIGFYR